MTTKEYILTRNDNHLAPNRIKKSICRHKNYNINFTRSYWFGTTLFAIRGQKSATKRGIFSQAQGWAQAVRPENRLEIAESNCPEL